MANDDTIYFQLPGDKFLQKLEDGTPLRGTAYQLCGTEYNVIKLDVEVDNLKFVQEKKNGNSKTEERPNASYDDFDKRMDQLEKKLAIVKKRLCKWAKAPVICEPPQEEEAAAQEEEPAEEVPAEEDEC